MKKISLLLLLLPFIGRSQTIYSYQTWNDGGKFVKRINLPSDSTAHLSDIIFIGNQLYFIGSDGFYHTIGTSAQEQTDWNATTGLAAILHKPTFAEVALTGSFSSLVVHPSTVEGYGISNAVNTDLIYSNPDWLSSVFWDKITGFKDDSTAAGFHTPGFYDARYGSSTIDTTVHHSEGWFQHFYLQIKDSTSYASFRRLYKALDSLNTIYLKTSDSTKYATFLRLYKTMDSISGVFVKNNGSAKGLAAGLLSARPSTSNSQTFYFATDIPKLSYDGSSGWIDLVGGGGGGISQIKARGPISVVGTDSIYLDTLRAQEIQYGNIYTRNSNFNANEIVSIGNAAFVINGAGNVVVTSGNSGTNANLLLLANIPDEVTQLTKFSRVMKFQANTTGFIGLGTAKSGVKQSVGDIAAWANMASSPIQFAIGNTSPSLLTNSGSYVNGPSWTVGDSIKVVLTYNDSTVTATVQNITTNSAVTSLTYNFVTSSSPFLPQISKWAWIAFSGQQTIYSEADSSLSKKYLTAIFMGTSKTTAYYATDFAHRFAILAGQNSPTVEISAGGSNMSNDYSRTLPQTINKAPLFLFIEAPCNDIRTGYGGTLAQAEKTIDSIINVCRARGIRWYVYSLPEDSVVTAGAGNAAVGLTQMHLDFKAKYGVNYISDTWDSLIVGGGNNRLQTGYYISDGIHPNGAANIVAGRILGRRITAYPFRQGQILNSPDNSINISNQGAATVNRKAILPGTANYAAKFDPSGVITSGFYDDGSTTSKIGAWGTAVPQFGAYKGGTQNQNNGLVHVLYDANLNSFNTLVSSLPGASLNNKQWAFTNNGATWHFYALGDASGLTDIMSVSRSGLTINYLAFPSGAPVLVNTTTTDGVSKHQVNGASSATNLALGGATPTSNEHLLLGAGTTTKAPVRWITGGALRTTPNGGAEEIDNAGDTRYYTLNSSTLRKQYVLTEPATGLYPTGVVFAAPGSNGRVTAGPTFTYDSINGTIMNKKLVMNNIPTAFAGIKIMMHASDSAVYQAGLGSGISVDGSGNLQFTGSSGLADPGSNGILKRTSTNVTAIASVSDFPTLNQNTTGTAAGVTGLSIQGGRYLPTSSGNTNVNVLNLDSSVYMRIGNVVTVDVNNTMSATLGTSTATVINVSLPITPSVNTLYCGMATFYQVAGSVGTSTSGSCSMSGTSQMACGFPSINTTGGQYSLHFSYPIN